MVTPNLLTKISTVFNANFSGIPEESITGERISYAERAANDVTGLVAAIAGFTIEILCEAKKRVTYLTGASHILEHPEFQDPGKAHRLLNYLSDSSELLKLPVPDEVGGTKIMIGPENVAEALKDSSVVMASYDTGDGMRGLIGVVGPTRMDYSKVASRLEYIARVLSKIPYDKGIPPELEPHKD